MIHIAMIDTYVQVPKKNKDQNNIYHYKIKKNKVVKEKKNHRGKIINHGCICYQVLYENTRDIEYTLHCIEVIGNNEKKSNIKNLITALEWCLENKIQIISLSVGTRDTVDGEMLNSIIGKLYDKGIIVVAAFNNQDTLTYPAVLKTVIGVCIDKKKALPLNSYIYVENDDKNIDIVAKCNFKDVESRIGIQIGEYNSYIVPYIVSIILRIKVVEDSISSKNVRAYLKKYSIKV